MFGGAGAAQAANWLRLAGALGSLKCDLALKAASREPACRRLSRLRVDAGNDPELFSANYRKFLETQMRKSLGFAGTPIRLLFRARRVARDALNKD